MKPPEHDKEKDPEYVEFAYCALCDASRAFPKDGKRDPKAEEQAHGWAVTHAALHRRSR